MVVSESFTGSTPPIDLNNTRFRISQTLRHKHLKPPSRHYLLFGLTTMGLIFISPLSFDYHKSGTILDYSFCEHANIVHEVRKLYISAKSSSRCRLASQAMRGPGRLPLSYRLCPTPPSSSSSLGLITLAALCKYL